MKSERCIDKVLCRGILDSRGYPTVEVDIVLNDGSFGRASAPSGASTGSFECPELRDGDLACYHGRGIKTCLHHLNQCHSLQLRGFDSADQVIFDSWLRQQEAGPFVIGSGGTLALSAALMRAYSAHRQIPLYQTIAETLGGKRRPVLPLPFMNFINGGLHAQGALDIQEIMIVPRGAPSFHEALRWGSEIFQALKKILRDSHYPIGVGDEGGFCPPLANTRHALDVLVQAIECAGYQLGEDIAFALDVAASTLYRNGQYISDQEKLKGKAEVVIDFYTQLSETYPLISIEDGLDENDWEGWSLMTQCLRGHIQLVGDDLFVTNTQRLRHGIDRGCATMILIKPNQVGTLSETFNVMHMAEEHGYGMMVSHRSGETNDTLIADLAVGSGCGLIKMGSISRGERIAKYNRLLRIYESLGALGDWKHSPWNE